MNLRPMRTVTSAPHPLALAAAWEKLYVDAHALLRARLEEHQVPEAEWAPAQDIAVVYRLPNNYQSPNGLVLPERYADHHDAPFSLGLLIFAGPEAMDVLESHGVMPGDYVKFARFAGEEEAVGRIQRAIESATGPIDAKNRAQRVRDEEMAKKKLLELQVPFIHGSTDLRDRLFGPTPTMEMVRQVDAKGNVTHVIQPLIEEMTNAA